MAERTEEIASEQQAIDDFAAGFSGDTTAPDKPEATPEEPAKEADAPEPKETAPVAAVPEVKPKYIRVTEEQFNRLSEAAEKTVTLEAQISKAFGTMGNLEQIVRKLQAETPKGAKVEIPDDAFAGMAKDFPEIAKYSREALETALKGLKGSGASDAAIDPATIDRLVTEATVKREIEALEDLYPDWKTIVGHVESEQQPDLNNPFRKWLATKDAGYQAKINGTNSATIIARAIRAFKADSKPTPKPAPTLEAQHRAARMKDAITPRGDGGQPSSRKTDEDEFAAGFHGR